MSSFADRLELLEEKAGLPGEALSGQLKLSITAGKRALVENHRGILSFDSSEICVAGRRGRLILRGNSLYIASMTGEWLLICGKIHGVEWE